MEACWMTVSMLTSCCEDELYEALLLMAYNYTLDEHVCVCVCGHVNLLLTFISDVLKFGIVVILVQNVNGELTDADERVCCLVCGR